MDYSNVLWTVHSEKYQEVNNTVWTSNKSAIDFKTIQFRQSKQKKPIRTGSHLSLFHRQFDFWRSCMCGGEVMFILQRSWRIVWSTLVQKLEPCKAVSGMWSAIFANYCCGSDRLLFQFLIRTYHPSQTESGCLSVLYHSLFDEREKSQSAILTSQREHGQHLYYSFLFKRLRSSVKSLGYVVLSH